MKMNFKLLSLILLLGTILISCNQNTESQKGKESGFINLSGPYLGQKLPGTIPEVFAPGIVSTERHEHSFPSFSPDGKQVLWSSFFQSNYNYDFPVKVISSELKTDGWSAPDFFDEITLSNSYEAFFSPDGKRIYFTSVFTSTENVNSQGKQDIWFIEKSNEVWMPPKNLDLAINTPNIESKATVTNNATLYYVGHYEGGKNNYGIYRSELIDGTYQTPELLPKNINTEYVDWTPFISPDESYLLFSSLRPGGSGSGDLYISFRNQDNSWTDPINLGSSINTEGNERYPYVSPDNKYLFFVTDLLDQDLMNNKPMKLKDYAKKQSDPGNGWGDVYWMDAKFIEDLRPESLK